MNQRILDCLIDLAKHVQPVGGTKIAAAIVYKDRIISVGTNMRKSHPLQKRFARNAEAIFLHAEIDAIRKLVSIPRGSVLYLARVYRNGSPALVTPCPGCLSALDHFRVTKVFHT